MSNMVLRDASASKKGKEGIKADIKRRVKNTHLCEERVQAWRDEPNSANERSPDN